MAYSYFINRTGPMTIKLTPAQARTYAQITEAPTSTPDKVLRGAFFLADDFSSSASRWNGNRVYGPFNTATLKCLESKGLIKVHRFGIGWRDDEIEVLAA